MVPRLLRLHPGTYQRLTRLSKEAEREGAHRVAKRLRAVVLNSEGRTSTTPPTTRTPQCGPGSSPTGRWLEVHQLPPYSPELNPTERLWQHTRKNGTHNRFFGGLDALLATVTRVFGEMQSHPQLIRSYLAPFC